MRLNKRIKDYKKSKFASGDDGYVVRKGRAVINIGAENFDDIFSAYCYKGGDQISYSLQNFLWHKSNIVDNYYDLTLRFHVKDACKEKQKEIKEALNCYYESEIHSIDRELCETRRLSTLFVFIGIVLAVTHLFILNKLPIYVDYFCDLFAWVFLWEGANAFFLGRSELKYNKFKLYRLRAAKVEVVEFENY